MHLHPDRYTFSYVLEGSAKLIFQNRTVRLKANDLIIIPPYLAHQTQIEQYFSYKLIRVTKPYSFVDTSFTHEKITLIRNSLFYKSHFDKWFQKNVESVNNSDLTVKKDRTVPDIFERFLTGTSAGNNDTLVAMKNAISHFTENFYRPIHIDELTDLTHISGSHFQRVFKKNVGISPMRYLLNLRIEKAKEYIKTKESFTDIALNTGFYDQSHFNKYFKLNVGMIPKRYADLVKND